MAILNYSEGAWRLAMAVVFGAMLAGCGSAGKNPASGVSGQVDSSELASALTPDGYPNINVVPRGEAAPLSNQEKSQLLSDLAAARARQSSGDASPATAAEIARLIRLARLHGIDAIAEIEDR